jgi:hypothetical protein
MEIETLNAMNDVMYLSLMMIKVTTLIFALLVIIGFVIYLAGMSWLCFEETRRSRTSPRTERRVSPPNTCKSAPHVASTQVSRTLPNKPRAGARGIAIRPSAF